MLDKVKLACDFCERHTYHSVPYIEGQIKAMKIHKRDEVVQQLKEKRGPFYDRWKAAMEKRGEQKRCSDCLSHKVGDPNYYPHYCIRKLRRVNPAWFACEFISYYEG